MAIRHGAATRIAFRTLALAAASLGIACGSPLSPAKVTGVYALESRGGAALPALILSSDAMDVYLISETLVLGANGRGQRSAVQEIRRIGEETETTTWQRQLVYDSVDDRIEITMICGPAELCTPAPHLVLYRSARGLQTRDDAGAPPVLSYVRVEIL